MIAFGVTLMVVAFVAFVLGWGLCEKAQQNVMSASARISDMAILASKNAATYEITTRNATTAVESMSAKLAELEKVVGSCDRSNGAIMHGLVSHGILKARAATPPGTATAPPLAEDAKAGQR